MEVQPRSRSKAGDMMGLLVSEARDAIFLYISAPEVLGVEAVGFRSLSMPASCLMEVDRR